MDSQIEQAVELAWNPTTEQGLKSQAFDFLNQVRGDPNGWQACLTLFTRPQTPAEYVRVVALDLVNNALQSQALDQNSLDYIRQSLMGYVQQHYAAGAAGVDSPPIQNKLTQTLTYLFTSLYASEWTSFFDDFRSLAGTGDVVGTANPAATMLYLRMIESVHDEIGDILIARSREEQDRNNKLKDLIRARDMAKIAVTWQEILSRWRTIDLGIVELCLRTIAKWVSWIDISVVIDGNIQSALLQLAGQQGQMSSESKEAKARDAAIDCFTETVAKKMSSRDKIELIRYLNLSEIVAQLIASPALSQLRNTPHYDTDLAETVAKLVNNVVFDLVKVLDTDGVDEQTYTRANELLQTFVPHLLRFFSDEYDEICTAVIGSLTDLLTMQRKYVAKKKALPSGHQDMLRPILDAIIAKMKYDDTADWGEEDDATDEAEFQELRKRLYVLQQTVAAVDERLYIDTLSNVIATTFTQLDAGGKQADWRELDLAMHEMYLFGELAVKNGGLYQKSTPSSDASQRLLEMMSKMVESGLPSHQHPAIQLQCMELCVRYVQFFEHNPGSITKLLERFIEFMHSTHPKVKQRSWYLFQRFARHLRVQMGEIAPTVVTAIGDLLVIKAETPEDKDEDDGSSEDNGQSADAAFTSQLYLFEAIGSIASTSAVPLETKVTIAQSVLSPLIADLQKHAPAAQGGDARSLLQIHHVIMAMGTLANGFSDWTPGATSGGPPPNDVSQQFVTASEAILAALEALKDSSDVRTAARHAFSRFLGVLGSNILPQLPRWIGGLLSSASSNDEMAMFLRTLAQVVYGFKGEIHAILDDLLSPLLQRVFAGLAQPTNGTDDEIQLRELKQQYLNFILVILNNDLGSVVVSQANQGSFETLIASLTRYATDPSDPQSARLAFSALGRLSAIFGGSDISPDATQTSPAVAGFDAFMLSQFSTLPWDLLRAPGFNSADAQMRSVMQEAAGLQWTMLRKTGATYRQQLEGELRNLGAGDDAAREYVKNMGGDVMAFKKFFVSFVQGGKR